MDENDMAIVEIAKAKKNLAEIRKEAVALIWSQKKFRPSQFKTKEELLIAYAYCEAIGEAPEAAIYEINIIYNRPSQSSNLISSRIRRYYPESEIMLVHNGYDYCEYWGKQKPSHQWSKFKFTKEEAEAMGYLDGSRDQWNKQRKVMLMHRCRMQMVRAIFPRATYGSPYDKYELMDMEAADRQKRIQKKMEKDKNTIPVDFDENDKENEIAEDPQPPKPKTQLQQDLDKYKKLIKKLKEAGKSDQLPPFDKFQESLRKNEAAEENPEIIGKKKIQEKAPEIIKEEDHDEIKREYKKYTLTMEKNGKKKDTKPYEQFEKEYWDNKHGTVEYKKMFFDLAANLGYSGSEKTFELSIFPKIKQSFKEEKDKGNDLPFDQYFVMFVSEEEQ